MKNEAPIPAADRKYSSLINSGHPSQCNGSPDVPSTYFDNGITINAMMNKMFTNIIRRSNCTGPINLQNLLLTDSLTRGRISRGVAGRTSFARLL
ncbi:MAG: hypothetical protein C00003105_02004 [ANME-2 cluster archaeon HR1]|nr:MAG: hypothetical protein C00003105_02004 [ANME-2 cluster archaeon HR1]